MIVNKSMKNTIFIYGSQYGSTKRYAEQLAKLTELEAVDYKEAKENFQQRMPQDRQFQSPDKEEARQVVEDRKR